MASTPCSASPACTRSSSIAGWPRSKIRHVTPRHEQGAGFMADGYARVSGKPGVALRHHRTGPDQHDHRDGAGARRFGADAGHLRRQRRGDARQGARLSARAAGPARHAGERGAVFAARSPQPANCPALLARAFAMFATGRPGPVHIEIPLDVMGKRGRRARRRAAFARPCPRPAPQQIAEAARSRLGGQPAADPGRRRRQACRGGRCATRRKARRAGRADRQCARTAARAIRSACPRAPA